MAQSVQYPTALGTQDRVLVKSMAAYHVVMYMRVYVHEQWWSYIQAQAHVLVCTCMVHNAL